MNCLICKREGANNVDFFQIYKFESKEKTFVCLGCLTGHFKRFINSEPMSGPTGNTPPSA